MLEPKHLFHALRITLPSLNAEGRSKSAYLYGSITVIFLVGSRVNGNMVLENSDESNHQDWNKVQHFKLERHIFSMEERDHNCCTDTKRRVWFSILLRGGFHKGGSRESKRPRPSICITSEAHPSPCCEVCLSLPGQRRW